MRLARGLMLALLVLGGIWTGEATAQTAPSAVLLRVFLADGGAVVTYGEWARVGDRVVFSVPLTPAADATDLHIVSLPAGTVDWPRTEQYAAAARAAHYAATRGESDFAAFSAEIARVLNEIAILPDPESRLSTALRAREALAEWPRRHYGYRAREVREMLALLDEVISELRVSAGQDQFELALVADGPPIPDVPLLPAPSHGELAEQLLTASRLAATPAERQSLLQTLVGLIDRAVDLLPSALATRLRGDASRLLAEERRLDRAYGALRGSTLAAAERYAARADVRSLERLRASVAREDDALGRQRPDMMQALVASVDSQLEVARRLRLAQDQWRLQIRGFRAYQRDVATTLDALRQASAGLEDIRSQAGPDPRVLQTLDARLTREGQRLAGVSPPPELAPIHALLRSARELAANAVTLRLEAVAAADLEQARHASAAAAGALLLVERARTELAAALRPPTLP